MLPASLNSPGYINCANGGGEGESPSSLTTADVAMLPAGDKTHGCGIVHLFR